MKLLKSQSFFYSPGQGLTLKPRHTTQSADQAFNTKPREFLMKEARQSFANYTFNMFKVVLLLPPPRNQTLRTTASTSFPVYSRIMHISQLFGVTGQSLSILIQVLVLRAIWCGLSLKTGPPVSYLTSWKEVELALLSPSTNLFTHTQIAGIHPTTWKERENLGGIKGLRSRHSLWLMPVLVLS